MVSSLYMFVKQFLAIEEMILHHIENSPIPITHSDSNSDKYKELAQHRIYILTELARTLGYDLIPYDPVRGFHSLNHCCSGNKK